MSSTKFHLSSPKNCFVEASGPVLVCLVDASTVPWTSRGGGGGRKSHQQNQEYSNDLKFSITDKWVRTRDAICEIGVYIYIYKCILCKYIYIHIASA